MIIIGNPKYRLIALGVSVGIFLILYFTVIKPSHDTANKAVIQGEQQVQTAVKNIQKQTGGAVPSGVVDLTSCLAAAGADTGKVQACQAKYKP